MYWVVHDLLLCEANVVDYGEEKKKKEDKKEEVTKSQEEKRKHIKTLIDKIPTEKTALFAFQLDWAAVDNVSIVYVRK